MKFTMKKFQLVRKYANYPTWDEKQNAPFVKKVAVILVNLSLSFRNSKRKEQT